jgi:hypothetical protein
VRNDKTKPKKLPTPCTPVAAFPLDESPHRLPSKHENNIADVYQNRLQKSMSKQRTVVWVNAGSKTRRAHKYIASQLCVRLRRKTSPAFPLAAMRQRRASGPVTACHAAGEKQEQGQQQEQRQEQKQ